MREKPKKHLLLTRSRTTRKKILFYVGVDEVLRKTVTIKKVPGKQIRMIDFVIKAWKQLGRQLPDNPLEVFDFRHSLANNKPTGVLGVGVVKH